MERLKPYLGIVGAIIFFVLILFLANNTPALPLYTTEAPVESATLSVEQGLILPPIELPGLALVASSSEESVVLPEKETPPPKRRTTSIAPAPTVEPAPVAAPPPATVAETNTALDVSATALRSALANILCYVPVGSGLHSISGSGIFVDSKGIILTNAHIAQYFLLADKNVTCMIRVGNPATNAYEAALIYIHPAWLNANATVLTQSSPIGTGEYDFALLAVTKSATSKALPVSFPSVPLAVNPPVKDTPVVMATYGAQFLESSQIQSALFPTVVFGSVKDVYTFATNTIDVLALGGSVAAQQGSSGGGVADASGSLVGTITTSTVSGATETRSLDAITASYIRAEYASETGEALDLLLAQSTNTSVSNFAPRIPALEAIITTGLP